MDKIKEKKLNKVAGGNPVEEPEEFDWRSKGYQTPVKDETKAPGSNWEFEAISKVDNYFKKIFTFKK